MRQSLLFVLLTCLSGLASGASAEYDFVPDWYEEGIANQGWGRTATTVGDVNGDGYSDILIGAPGYSLGGYSFEGQVFLYYGSKGGLPSSPAWSWGSGVAIASFGASAAPAGDMNGDGYADFVVGAPTMSNGEDQEGRIYFFLGSASGPVNWSTAESHEPYAWLGVSVAWAGDVNGDGYDDVIAGASQWGGFGSPLHVPVQGAAYVYHGAPAGPLGSSEWSRIGGHTNGEFGAAVAGLGDVNGDGFDDVMVGQPGYDPGFADSDHGQIFAFYGSATGLSTTPSWSQVGTAGGNRFGRTLSFVGDYSGDGYADALIGVGDYAGGVGAVFLAGGSPTGLSPAVIMNSGPETNYGADVAGIGDFDGDGRADFIVGGSIVDDVWVYFGTSGPSEPTIEHRIDGGGEYGEVLSGAGDINGDGFHDFLVIDPIEANSAGVARVYMGGPRTYATLPSFKTFPGANGEELGTAVAAAGDVNGDGVDDIILGAAGKGGVGAARIHYGSVFVIPGTPNWSVDGPGGSLRFGERVAAAGDVNGDGYADVLVGDPEAQRVHVFHGSSTGPSTTADETISFGVAGSSFGKTLAGAGDFNGDGFADIAIGAPDFAQAGAEQGLVRVYLGSPNGIRAASYIDRVGNAAGDRFGASLAFVGDCNRDGYDELLIGTPGASVAGAGAGAGKITLQLGNSAGTWGTDLILDGNEAGAALGYAVAAVGDTNGDGYADFAVGEPFHDANGNDAGRVRLYLGGPVGLALVITHTATGGKRYGQTLAGLGDPDGLGRGMIVTTRQNSSGVITHVELLELYGLSMVLRSSFMVHDSPVDLPIAAAGDIDGDGFPDIAHGLATASAGDGLVRLYGPISQQALLPPAVKPRVRTLAANPIALRGQVPAGEALRFTAVGWVPAGRTRVALEWEAGLVGQPKSTGQAWAPSVTHIGGTPLTADVLSTWAPGDRVTWRLRIRSGNPYVPTGRWRTAQPNVASLYSMYVAPTVTAVEAPTLPTRSALGPATPNPFNPSTTLHLSLTTSGRVSLRIVDAAGRRVRELHAGELPAGEHDFVWNGRDDRARAVASGVYYAVLQGSGNSTGRQKLVLVK